MRSAPLWVGVDENGLGPVLGPLVVTGVALSSTKIEAKSAANARPRNLGATVGDSKALSSHADSSLGEAWARVLLGACGDEPTSPAEIVARVSIDGDEVLREGCPRDVAGTRTGVEEACFSRLHETFSASDERMARCRDALARWRKRGLEIVGVRSVIVCASRLNGFATSGVHKFSVDLHSMERVTLDLGARHDRGELDAVLGKVGGMKSYGRFFGPLAGRLHAIEEESQAASIYRFPGLGRLAFVRDADASDPLVGLASLVGKYLRELFMRRLTTALDRWKIAGEIVEDVSGYHDPKTKRLIAATELLRARVAMPDRCFSRSR